MSVYIIIILCLCRSWQQRQPLPTTVRLELPLRQSNLWCRPQSRALCRHCYQLQENIDLRHPIRCSVGCRGDRGNLKTKGFVVHFVSWRTTTRNISNIISLRNMDSDSVSRNISCRLVKCLNGVNLASYLTPPYLIVAHLCVNHVIFRVFDVFCHDGDLVCAASWYICVACTTRRMQCYTCFVFLVGMQFAECCELYVHLSYVYCTSLFQAEADVFNSVHAFSSNKTSANVLCFVMAVCRANSLNCILV